MITRSPSLTDQVKSHIRQRIADGGFEDGRIPPETELAEELGVSRTTVRDALSRLENEGAIYRRQGAGTFVNEHGLRIKSRLEEIWSYEQVLADHGYEPSVQVLSESSGPTDDATAEQLGLDPSDEVLSIEKVFLENRDPVIVTVNRIPTAMLVDTDYTADEAAPLFQFVEEHCDRSSSTTSLRSSPSSSTPTPRQRLVSPRARRPSVSMKSASTRQRADRSGHLLLSETTFCGSG